MEISDTLAYQIYIIVLFHWIAVIALLVFSSIIAFRARPSKLLASYLVLVGLILLWMLSKIFKTLSPNVGLRWFFVVTQYVGVQYLGSALLIFARLYKKGTLFSRKILTALLVPPTIGFIVVLTNPLHMKFYAYFDFYRDKFGSWFLPIQVMIYLYLFVGIGILAKGYTKQTYFKNHSLLARCLAVTTLIPVGLNIYYILFKLVDIPWIFPFPVFDITPISSTMAIMLFMIPALNYRFLDIAPISMGQIYDKMRQGMVLIDANNQLYAWNRTFRQLIPTNDYSISVKEMTQLIPSVNKEQKTALENYIKAQIKRPDPSITFILELTENQYYKASIVPFKNGSFTLSLLDITSVILLKNTGERQQVELKVANNKLEELAIKAKELARMQAQTAVSQHVHDILGHHLTIAMGMLEVAALDSTRTDVKPQLTKVTDLLDKGLFELNHVLNRDSVPDYGHSLIDRIKGLSNDSIHVDFLIQGQPYQLSDAHTHNLYHLCQEAVTNGIKHGQANVIHIILRYKPKELILFIIDDGKGCKQIKMNYGLKGIKKRVAALGGEVFFSSEEGTGFHIKSILPI